jgi:hypothetical protein
MLRKSCPAAERRRMRALAGISLCAFAAFLFVLLKPYFV